MIRLYRENDWPQMLELYNRFMTADRITEEFFVQYILLSPNFDGQGVFVDEENGRIVAWGMAQIVRRNYDIWGSQAEKLAGKGFIFLPVTDDLDRAKALIAACEKYLTEAGCSNFRSGAPGYTLFANGVDPELYPVVHRAFTESSYTSCGISYSMHRRLDNYKPTEEVQTLYTERLREGFEFKVCEYSDLPAIRRMLENSDLKGWMHLPLRKAEQHRVHEIVIAKYQGDAVGYCQYNYFDNPERIGPFGVDGSMRGKNIGTVMIAKLFDVMSQRNVRYAWFASCAPERINFYSRNGLEVFRKKDILVKTV